MGMCKIRHSVYDTHPVFVASHLFAGSQRTEYALYILCRSGQTYNAFFTVDGKLILILEDGTQQVIDQPGSLVVQKGTVHAWKNPGPTWTRWMTMLVDAEPATVNGAALEPQVIFDKAV
jgi:hypothetical protein